MERASWHIAGRERLVLISGIGSPWEPGGTLCTWGVPLGGALWRWEIFHWEAEDSCAPLCDLHNGSDLGSDPHGSREELCVPGVFPWGVLYGVGRFSTGRPKIRALHCVIFGPALFASGMKTVMLDRLLVTLPRVGYGKS